MTEEDKIKYIQKAAADYLKRMKALRTDFMSKIKGIMERNRHERLAEIRKKIFDS